MFGRSGERRTGYAVAVGATAATLLVRLPLDPPENNAGPLFLVFCPAIMLAAFLGGFRPGMLATALSAAAVCYFYLDPVYSFRIEHTHDAVALGLFVLVGLFLSTLNGSLRRSRDRIAANERRYAVTLASIGDAVIATDAEALVTFLNPAAEALTGWQAADAVGRPLAEVFRIVNEQTRQPVENPAEKVLRTGTVVGLANHTALISRDGRETPIDDCGAPIVDDRGAVAGVVLVFRDVTGRRRAEEAEAARRANERMELAVRGSQVGVWVIDMPGGGDRPGRRHYLNVWEQLGFDRPPDGWRGGTAEPAADYSARFAWTADPAGPAWEGAAVEVHPDDAPRVARAIRLHLAGETAGYEAEARFRCRDGSYRTMLARGCAVRDAAGKPVRFAGTLLDVTPLKRTEEALRASEARFRALVQNSSDIISLFAADGSVVYQSPSVARLLGHRAEDRIGKNVYSDPIVHPDDAAAKRAFFEAVQARPDFPVTAEFRLRHADGSWRDIEAIGQNFLHDPSVGGIVANYRDVTERKRAEDALRAGEHRFRVFVDHAADGFFLQDEQGRILDVNRRACESLGYARDELIGMTPFDFDPDITPARVEDLGRKLAAGETVGFESRHRRKDGTTFPVEVRGRAFSEGGRRFLVSLARDVTDRRRAEEALRESEERFRTLAKATNDAVWDWDLGTNTVWWNEGILTLFGYRLDANEAGPAWWLERVHPEDRGAVEAFFYEVVRGTERTWVDEYRFRCADGSYKDVFDRRYVLRDAGGRATRMIGAMLDITDRKRTEEALRQSEERLRLAKEAAGLGIHDFDVRTGVIQWDARVREIWAASPDEPITYERFLDGVHPEDRGATQAAVDRALDPGGDGQYYAEYRVVNREDSQPRWVAATGSVTFADGRAVRLVGTVQDITQRRQLEDERRRAKEAAEAANRAKDEFLANVSHELRTPMGAILGMTELALDTALTDDQREYLSTVKAAADNLLGILNDLLDFAKIEAGKMELDPADFSLRAVVGGTLRVLAARAHKKGIELVHSVHPDVPDALIGDAGRLRQVLLNLVGNAIKFTDAGEVEVRVEVAAEPAGGRAAEEVGLRFTVRDTGIGIPRAQQERIFRAFEQEDTSTTRRYGGTGLGLTISARLVALMGGTIAVDSEPGRGSTFAFTARFGRQPHPPERAVARPPAVLRDLPVLVVDDNATNRHILEEWLRGWGMRPDAAEDAAAALDALRRAAAADRPYPLVLLDARMPDTDGLALAGQIRQDPGLSAARIILLTSGDRPGDAARAREVRVDAHLLKPVQPDDLLGTIHRVLSRGERRGTGDDGGASSPRPVPTAVPLEILVAEDNEFNAQLLEQLLGKRGHRVRVAADGRSALALALTGAFDLLLLDVHMPELDGFGVVRAIREGERTTGRRLPVIALTARSRKEDREKCLAAGMDEFLSKPIRADELFAAIDQFAVRGPGPGARGQDAAPGPGLLDPRAVLAACGGDAAILERVCQAFRAGLPPQMEAVRAAARDADAARLREAAHRLCGMIGAFSTVAGNVASELEDVAAEGRLDAAAALVDRLDAMARELVRLTDGLSLEALRQQADAADSPPRDG